MHSSQSTARRNQTAAPSPPHTISLPMSKVSVLLTSSKLHILLLLLPDDVGCEYLLLKLNTTGAGGTTGLSTEVVLGAVRRTARAAAATRYVLLRPDPTRTCRAASNEGGIAHLDASMTVFNFAKHKLSVGGRNSNCLEILGGAQHSGALTEFPWQDCRAAERNLVLLVMTGTTPPCRTPLMSPAYSESYEIINVQCL